MGYRGTHNGRRFRRARRRGRMTPAIATRISTRTRKKGWLITKNITRHHRRDWTYSDWT